MASEQDKKPIEEGYLLGRDQTESQRLNNQHSLLTQYVKLPRIISTFRKLVQLRLYENRMLGYYIHPLALERLGRNAQIADIATGTAIWLNELAAMSPVSFNFHGFDISEAQYPDSGQLPSNVALHLHDAKRPFPSDWRERFDFVQIRLLNAAMTDKDWDLVLNNTLDILKPGGAIQWIEPNFMGMPIAVAADDGTQPVAHLKVFHQVVNLSGLSAQSETAVDILPRLFSAARMTDIETTAVTGHTPELRRDWSANHLGLMLTTLEKFVSRGVPGVGSAEDVQSLRTETMKEHEKGCYFPMETQLTFGFKEMRE